MTDDRIRLVVSRAGGWVSVRGKTPADTRRFNERFAARNWCVPMREADVDPKSSELALCMGLEQVFGPDVTTEVER